ncbi:MAG: hypothetical protein K5739_01430 [Lachnospiraceae bacterium]|nr:hypothetical protein [Lachnospiraceae bacterium]
MNERKKRTNLIRQSGTASVWEWPCLLLFGILTVYLSHRIGMQGISYLAFPVLLYLLLSRWVGMTSREMIARRVSFYRTRDAFLSANKCFHVICIAENILMIGILAAVFILSDQISLLLFHTVLCSLGLKLVSVATLIRIWTLAQGGYLEGMGIGAPMKVANLVAAVSSLVVAFFTSGPLSDYAKKISDLMRTESYYYAYMSVLGTGSVLVGNLLAALVMLCLKAALMKRIHRIYDGGASKNSKPVSEIVFDYLQQLLSRGVRECFLYLPLILICGIAMHTRTEDGMWIGSFMTALLLLFLPPLLLQRHITMVTMRGLTREIKARNLPGLRERMALCLKVLMYCVLPYLTLLLSMARPIGKTLFDTEEEMFAMSIRFGVWVSLFAVLALFANGVISVTFSKAGANLLLSGGSIMILLLGIVFLKKQEMAPEKAIMLSLLISMAVLLVVHGILIWNRLHFCEDLLRIFVLTMVSSVVLGLLAFIICHVMPDNPISVLLGAVLGSLSYVICIVMTHTFDPHEWHNVPGSAFPVSFAKYFKLY